ncbi:hypothetical protein IFM89_027689 [Coptis chinensis]|uniref:Ppx/GppA phosphatase N-terminal domain-containing protein n=1 Tax=Coptis chinensis TaxID=261450 RepID=A0A835MDQ9_9MAGN|nr:hypothetical protein IFM89_027689 [Coptis chinensis]
MLKSIFYPGKQRVGFLGVLQFLPVYDKIVLTVDISGGSTEFVVGKKGVVVFAISLKLGHVSLTEMFGKCGEVGKMREYIRSVVFQSGLVEKIGEIGFEVVVGSSGTIRAIEKAVWMGYAQDLMTGVFSHSDFRRNWKFSRNNLNNVVDNLFESDRKGGDDVRRNEFFKRRSECILADAVLLSEIFEILKIDEIEVFEFALGEGVIAETLARCCRDYDVNANVRWRSVVDAGKDEVLANGALKHEEKDIKEPEEENALEGEFIKLEKEALDVKDCLHTDEATRDLEIKPSVVQDNSSTLLASIDFLEAQEKTKELWVL